MSAFGTLHLLVGPVGAGKSTLGRQLAHEHAAVFLDVDEWMVRLFGQDERPETDVIAWYLERRERVREQIWQVAIAVLQTGTDVVLESGLVGRAERLECYARVRAEGVSFRVVVIDAPREVRRQRVRDRNASAGPLTQVVPDAMFEVASDAWEPLDPAERSSVQWICF